MSGELSVAEDERFATAKVADGVLLDSRLALYHETQRWLAVSDLHLGSDPLATARPEMLKLWGTPDIETRLLRLVDHYEPRVLIVVGDVMNFNAEVEEVARFVNRISHRIPSVWLAGNHDHPELVRSLGFAKSHQEDGFLFHHGHRLEEMLNNDGPAEPSVIHVTGHSHPLTVIERDGSTLRRPVFADLPYPNAPEGVRRWIMPAFSPWASGAWPLRVQGSTRLFAIEPSRISAMS
jgi:uncharacterized protein